MKFDFCCVCGVTTDLHDHHIEPVVYSGKRVRKHDATITLCSFHHNLMHGLEKDRKLHHSNMIKEGLRKTKKKIGRPTVITPDKIELVRKLKSENKGINRIGKELSMGSGTIQKIFALLV